MYPDILKIGPLVIRAYGLTLALSFFLGLYFLKWRARKYQLDSNKIFNLAFVVMVAGVLGARIFFVMLHWSEFRSNPLAIFNPFQGGEMVGIAGLNLYGGVVTALISMSIFLKFAQLPFWATLDIFVAPFAFGNFLTRIGCFLNGCCFGKATGLPWSVVFPSGSIPDSVPELAGQALHPTQLYSSLFALILFFVLLGYDNRKKFYGSTAAVYLMVDGVFRFFIEFIRYYEPEMLFRLNSGFWTYNQLVALGFFALGLALYLILKNRFPLTHK